MVNKVNGSLLTLTLILLALIWGSSFILMKKGMFTAEGAPVFSATQVGALRLAFAGLALSPLALRAMKHIAWKDWKWVAAVACLGSGFPAFLFTHAQQHIDSSLAGILNATTPLFTLLVGTLAFGASVSKEQVSGVLIGLVGAAGLIALDGIGKSERAVFALLAVLATLSYGFSVNTIQHKLGHVRPIELAALSMLMVGIPCAAIALSSGAWEVISTHPSALHSLTCIALLGVGGSALANAVFFWLTGVSGGLFAASVTYLIPLVAVAWGWADDEPIRPGHLLFGLVILFSIWQIRRK